jgi:sigma-70-like protein
MKSKELTSPDLKEAGTMIVEALLADGLLEPNPISEASVHRPRRSRIWQAVYTGARGGQVWRSTGLANKQQALLVARRWESEARAQRAKMVRRPMMRVRNSALDTDPGLTQEEIAQIMHISVRAVRAIEKRAIKKLLRHPALRQLWQDYSGGQLNEEDPRLTAVEIAALFSLAHNAQEYRVIEKVLLLVQT